MTAKKTQSETNRETSENTTLVAYRLQEVESALKTLTGRFDAQDNIKRSDLVEFRDTIVNRFNDVKTDLQGQITELKKEKAGSQELKDFKKQVGAAAVFVSSLVIAAFSYMLTRLK